MGKRIEFTDATPSFALGDPVLQLAREQMVAFADEFGYDGAKVDNTVVQPCDLGVPMHLESVTEWIKKHDWEKILRIE